MMVDWTEQAVNAQIPQKKIDGHPPVEKENEVIDDLMLDRFGLLIWIKSSETKTLISISTCIRYFRCIEYLVYIVAEIKHDLGEEKELAFTLDFS